MYGPKVFLFPLKSQQNSKSLVRFPLLMKRLPVCVPRHQLTPPRKLLRLKHFREILESQQNWPFGRAELGLNKTCNDWASSVENWGQIGSLEPKAAKYAHIQHAQTHMEKSCFLTRKVLRGLRAFRPWEVVWETYYLLGQKVFFYRQTHSLRRPFRCLDFVCSVKSLVPSYIPWP